MREAWGRRPRRGSRLLFLLGPRWARRGPDLGTLVSWENRRYGDLLLWDFLGVPFNQTLKDLMLLAWLGRHCPRRELCPAGPGLTPLYAPLLCWTTCRACRPPRPGALPG